MPPAVGQSDVLVTDELEPGIAGAPGSCKTQHATGDDSAANTAMVVRSADEAKHTERSQNSA